jgi:hypothetical protein
LLEKLQSDGFSGNILENKIFPIDALMPSFCQATWLAKVFGCLIAAARLRCSVN